MNDNAPKFEQTSYTCWLSEEASRGQLVTLVSASDPDVGILQYSIAAGNQHHTFAIDAETGIIIKYVYQVYNIFKQYFFVFLCYFEILNSLFLFYSEQCK